MSYANIANSNELNNHELNKFVDKMTELLKLEAVQAINSEINGRVYSFVAAPLSVGGRTALEYPSVASVVGGRFASLDDSMRRAIRVDLGRDENITDTIRRWNIDMRSSKPVLDQIDATKSFSFVNEDTFGREGIEAISMDVSDTGTATTAIPVYAAIRHDVRAMEVRYGRLIGPDVIGRLVQPDDTTASLNTGVKFRVHQVKCVDETNPEWPGHDEIAWGGATVDPNGTTTKINEYYVGGGFDDGDKKNYSPPKIVKSFSLNGGSYPKTFMVTLALAEKDAGGFSDFIKELYDAIKAEIQLILSALGAAAGGTIGAEVGGSVGTAIGGPLGTIIGIVAGAILGALIGWLISALKDDIFEPEASSLVLHSGSDTFEGGSLVSPPMYFHYRDHGGHYRVKYDWEIVR